MANAPQAILHQVEPAAHEIHKRLPTYFVLEPENDVRNALPPTPCTPTHSYFQRQPYLFQPYYPESSPDPCLNSFQSTCAQPSSSGTEYLAAYPRSQLKTLIRNQLLREDINLAMPPYTNPNGTAGTLEVLARRYSDLFHVQYDITAACMEEMRREKHRIELESQVSPLRNISAAMCSHTSVSAGTRATNALSKNSPIEIIESAADTELPSPVRRTNKGNSFRQRRGDQLQSSIKRPQKHVLNHFQRSASLSPAMRRRQLSCIDEAAIENSASRNKLGRLFSWFRRNRPFTVAKSVPVQGKSSTPLPTRRQNPDDLNAREMTMGNEERIYLMSMVKSGALSVDDAISAVKVYEDRSRHLLALRRSDPQDNARGLSPACDSFSLYGCVDRTQPETPISPVSKPYGYIYNYGAVASPIQHELKAAPAECVSSSYTTQPQTCFSRGRFPPGAHLCRPVLQQSHSLNNTPTHSAFHYNPNFQNQNPASVPFPLSQTPPRSEPLARRHFFVPPLNQRLDSSDSTSSVVSQTNSVSSISSGRRVDSIEMLLSMLSLQHLSVPLRAAGFNRLESIQQLGSRDLDRLAIQDPVERAKILTAATLLPLISQNDPGVAAQTNPSAHPVPMYVNVNGSHDSGCFESNENVNAHVAIVGSPASASSKASSKHQVKLYQNVRSPEDTNVKGAAKTPTPRSGLRQAIIPQKVSLKRTLSASSGVDVSELSKPPICMSRHIYENISQSCEQIAPPPTNGNATRIPQYKASLTIIKNSNGASCQSKDYQAISEFASTAEQSCQSEPIVSPNENDGAIKFSNAGTSLPDQQNLLCSVSSALSISDSALNYLSSSSTQSISSNDFTELESNGFERPPCLTRSDTEDSLTLSAKTSPTGCTGDNDANKTESIITPKNSADSDWPLPVGQAQGSSSDKSTTIPIRNVLLAMGFTDSESLANRFAAFGIDSSVALTTYGLEKLLRLSILPRDTLRKIYRYARIVNAQNAYRKRSLGLMVKASSLEGVCSEKI